VHLEVAAIFVQCWPATARIANNSTNLCAAEKVLSKAAAAFDLRAPAAGIDGILDRR